MAQRQKGKSGWEQLGIKDDTLKNKVLAEMDEAGDVGGIIYLLTGKKPKEAKLPAGEVPHLKQLPKKKDRK